MSRGAWAARKLADGVPLTEADLEELEVGETDPAALMWIREHLAEHQRSGEG